MVKALKNTRPITRVLIAGAALVTTALSNPQVASVVASFIHGHPVAAALVSFLGAALALLHNPVKQ